MAAFRAALPEDSEEPVPESVDVETSVTTFPDGSYAATCHTQVRFQRIGLTRELAVVATSEMLNEFALPQFNQICAGDQLVLFDTVAASTKAVPAPEPLDVVGKGVAGSYLYFADGAREVALQASQKLHIFDGVSEAFSTVEFEEDVGILFSNFNTMHRPVGQGQIVALATGGPTRTNPRGITQPPLAGNRGLLVVDLPNATAAHMALPEGFQRVVALPNQAINQQGLRTFGMFPIVGRAFAYSQKPNGGPGNPGGTAILTWDVASGRGHGDGVARGRLRRRPPSRRRWRRPSWRRRWWRRGGAPVHLGLAAQELLARVRSLQSRRRSDCYRCRRPQLAAGISAGWAARSGAASRDAGQFRPHMPPMQAGPPQRCSAGVAQASAALFPELAENVEKTRSIEWLPHSQLSGSGAEPITSASKRESHSPHWYS